MNFYTNSFEKNYSKKSHYRSLTERARGGQFVFVVLNGVYSGRERSIGGASRPRQCGDLGRPARRSGIRGRRRRGRRRADKAAWSIRSAPIVDHFEGSVFERNPRKCFPLLFPRLGPASHNCDLRGTGQLRPGDNAAATRDGQSNNLDPAVLFVKVRDEIPSTGRSRGYFIVEVFVGTDRLSGILPFLARNCFRRIEAGSFLLSFFLKKVIIYL